MIELKKDKKSTTWIITTTDSEGFHRQLNMSANDLDEIVRLWEECRAKRNHNRLHNSTEKR